MKKISMLTALLALPACLAGANQPGTLNIPDDVKLEASGRGLLECSSDLWVAVSEFREIQSSERQGLYPVGSNIENEKRCLKFRVRHQLSLRCANTNLKISPNNEVGREAAMRAFLAAFENLTGAQDVKDRLCQL